MTTKLIKTLAVASVVSFASCDQKADVATENLAEEINTEEPAISEISIDDVSYSLGVNIANDFKAREISNLNVESFKTAIDAVMENTPHKIAPEQWGMTLKGYFDQINEAKKNGTDVPVPTADEMDNISYSFGASFASNVYRQGLTKLNSSELVAALETVMANEAGRFSKLEANQILQEYFGKLQAEKAKQQEAANAGIKQESIDFLTKNAENEGVTVTESGLQYMVLQEGSGDSPTSTSKVTVHYHGTTPDGTVFDSSVDRGQPASFGLNQVIRGWTEGLQLMKPGAKYRFFIPQDLAYGANPRPGGPIKPYMALVFDVELISIDS